MGKLRLKEGERFAQMQADTNASSGGHGRSHSTEGGIWVGPGKVRVSVKGLNKGSGYRKAWATVKSCSCKG